jgi:hypothetical protein
LEYVHLSFKARDSKTKMIRGEEVEGEKWLMREGTNALGGEGG